MYNLRKKYDSQKCPQCGMHYTITNKDFGCMNCKTKGIIEKMQNQYNDTSEKCPACRGTKVQKDRNGINVLCPVCHGKGVIYRDYNGEIQKIFW